MKKIIFIVLIIGFLLNGCASLNTVMDSYVGYPIDDVTSLWGAPQSIIDRKDGGKTYTWISFWQSQLHIHQCRQSFTTNRDGVVIKWMYHNC